MKSAARAAAMLRASRGRRLLLLEATICLGMARAMVLLLPFRRLAPALGRPNLETGADCDDRERDAVARIGWALRRLSPRLPWTCNCLAQAIAARWMLKRRGVGSTLYLGVRKDGSLLAAHAWLRVGRLIVTGGEARAGFTTVSFYGDRLR